MELTDKEKFLLHYLRNRQIKWGIDESVKNLFGSYGQVIYNLEQSGYLITDNHSYFLEILSISDLKVILKDLTLSVIGKKKELIDRIKENTTEDQREKICSDSYYVLTEKGIEVDEKYKATKRMENKTLKEIVKQKIETGNFTQASLEKGASYSKAVIAPGIGVDWTDTNEIQRRSEVQQERLKNYDFSDLNNSKAYIELLFKTLYYDIEIEHNLHISISEIVMQSEEKLNCPALDKFFIKKGFMPSEQDKVFVYLDTKRFNAFQNNMKALLKKEKYSPLPEGKYKIEDRTIERWKELREYKELLNKNIIGFPKTFETFLKHKMQNSDKYNNWILS